MKLSIIIPAFEEPYLNRTIDSLLANAAGEVEVIPVIDGYDPGPLPKDSRVQPVVLKRNRGMRGAINAGLEAAKGEFVAKVDAHVAFAPGFDFILTRDMAPSHLIIPRRYSLDEDSWEPARITRYFRDYHYFSAPVESESGYGMFVGEWKSRDRARRGIAVDETMAFQGSFWLAHRRYFLEQVGLLDDRPETYGPFSGDQLEIGLRYWLGGGEIKVNKNTWYAHLSKRRHHYLGGGFSRRHKGDAQALAGNEWAARHWTNGGDPGMLHPLSWLVERFSPVPTWGNC
jgi:glycosyltransferase involved in cell wall biosynthesis